METGKGYGDRVDYLEYTISLSVSVKDRPLHWVLGRS